MIRFIIFAAIGVFITQGNHVTKSDSRSQRLRKSIRGQNHRQVQAESLGRIVGGNDAPREAFTFYVRLENMQDGSYCGGSLVAPDVVLTAAHCDPTNSAMFRVRVNAYNANLALATKSEFQTLVAEKRKKPDFNTNTLSNDLLLLKLKDAILVDYISPIKINTEPFLVGEVQKFRVIGMGRTSEGGLRSNVLQEVIVSEVDINKCASAYAKAGFSVVKSVYHFCANDLGKDGCSGDSGGPITNMKGEQVGIVSFGLGCARIEYPGVYVRLSSYKDWIESTIFELSSYYGKQNSPNPSSLPVETFAPSQIIEHSEVNQTELSLYNYSSISPTCTPIMENVTFESQLENTSNPDSFTVLSYAPSSVSLFMQNESFPDPTDSPVIALDSILMETNNVSTSSSNLSENVNATFSNIIPIGIPINASAPESDIDIQEGVEPSDQDMWNESFPDTMETYYLSASSDKDSEDVNATFSDEILIGTAINSNSELNNTSTPDNNTFVQEEVEPIDQAMWNESSPDSTETYEFSASSDNPSEYVNVTLPDVFPKGIAINLDSELKNSSAPDDYIYAQEEVEPNPQAMWNESFPLSIETDNFSASSEYTSEDVNVTYSNVIQIGTPINLDYELNNSSAPDNPIHGQNEVEATEQAMWNE